MVINCLFIIVRVDVFIIGVFIELKFWFKIFFFLVIKLYFFNVVLGMENMVNKVWLIILSLVIFGLDWLGFKIMLKFVI